MTYVTAEARQQLLDDLAIAIEELGTALAALGAAYELLDENSADRLEDELFRGVQTAYGRAQRTHAVVRRALLAAGPHLRAAQPPACRRRARARSSSAPARRSTRPTTRSSSCRTRCCRSRSATASCAPDLAEVRTLVEAPAGPRARVRAHASAAEPASAGLTRRCRT